MSGYERGGTSPRPASTAAYTVKSIETVAEDRNLRARLYTMASEDIIPWHVHSEVTDWYFCLEGMLRIQTRSPDADECIAAGGRYAISPGTVHRISNGGGSDCRFVLLQGVGAYDFRKVTDPGT